MAHPTPAVDVVIAAHDPAREVARAVASVLDGVREEVRVTVVAHGRRAAEFTGRALADRRVRVIEFDDGIRSPAGPFNHGIAAADAEYVSIMGSDDLLEPGAISAWLAHARTRDTDYLMAVLRNQDGALWRDPLTRPRRHTTLDLVRDRLAYRAAPLGLIRRRILGAEPLTPGLATGEDIDVGLRLLTGEAVVDVGVGLPAYVIGDDAPERITFEARPVEVELLALRMLGERAWTRKLAAARREAVSVKLWRMNLIPAILVRADEVWTAEGLAAVRDVATWLDTWAPRARASLSRSEYAVADAAATGTADGIAAGVARAKSATAQDRVRTRSLRDILRVDAPLRRMIRARMAP